MPHYIVKWNAGYGEEYETVDAKDLKDAEEQAFQLWNDAVQSNADYEVIGEATDELIEEYVL